MKLSNDDIAILRLLQKDATLSQQELAERLSLSPSTVWRRLQALDKAGVIAARVALLDPRPLGLRICVITNVTLRDHSEAATTAFSRLVDSHPEIMECYALSGAFDYMLKIRVRDVEEYEAFLTRNLLRNPHVASVSSGFVLREMKYATALPL